MNYEESCEMSHKKLSEVFPYVSSYTKRLQNNNLEALTSSLSIKIPSLKRSYTITSTDDMNNIQNGRCPTYALYWEEETNKTYWSPNHNFYIGKKD